MKQADNYLVDYLAIFSEKRNSGIGSNLIKLLAGYMDGMGSVIVEVEDPQYGSNDEDRELRTRRLSFYLRNGCFDTGVRVSCFGVEFIILKMGNTEIEKEMCWDIYSSFYKAVLPEGMYDENIELLGYMNG